MNGQKIRRVDRTRKSAKQVITALADELLARRAEADVGIKLVLIQTIALRMNWNELYDRLRWREKVHEIPRTRGGTPAADPELDERREPWWNR